ncbi:unnamed protein product [Rhizophagus irregularis]|nr:unnamed protein product [Rhizophagus irregularis]
MNKLNRDILYLIFKELRDNKKSLCSCLPVNKEFCEIVIQILWKNPWKYLEYERESLLLNTIISHLSKESRNNLKSHDIYPLITLYENLSFNYIGFCKYLNLSIINKIIYLFKFHEISIIQNEIIKLFINENTKFTHLYVPQEFNYQINLIPGAKQCFSDIIFLSCNVDMNDNVLTGLTEICESIKELELYIKEKNNNFGVIKLIDIPKKLINVHIHNSYSNNPNINNNSFNKILENSLMKHAQIIQHFKINTPPITKILTTFVNLKELELDGSYHYPWNCLENLSLPLLQTLKTRAIPVEILASLIENTSGYLTKISIDCILYEEVINKKIIQAIYQKCPKLKYLKLILINENISEFENILIKCQYLDELFISVDNLFDPRELFEILIRSSPISLFKFKFNNLFIPNKLESLKRFLDNWKGRHPMFLQFNYRDIREYSADIMSLMKKYKAKGIIKEFDMHFE